MFHFDDHTSVPYSEIELKAVRSQGAGGQNVNKVASAIHLRFDINNSSLPERVKARMLKTSDSRVNQDGVLVIKSQEHRYQERNKQEALERLRAFFKFSMRTQKRRIPTRPSKAAKARRMDQKTQHGRKKQGRGRVNFSE